MSDSRTKNTTRNIFSGLINRGVTILLPFINRTVILTVLGAEYTGLSSLFMRLKNLRSENKYLWQTCMKSAAFSESIHPSPVPWRTSPTTVSMPCSTEGRRAAA